MKTLLIAAALAASVGCAFAAPSFAQDAPPPPAYPDRPAPPGMDPGMGMDHPGGEWTLERREAWLEARIDRGSAAGRLSGNEEQRGRAELDAIRTEQAKLSDRDGGRLSPEDHSYVANRIDGLNRTLRWQGENPPPPWLDRF